jgi:hypothetical protein
MYFISARPFLWYAIECCSKRSRSGPLEFDTAFHLFFAPFVQGVDGKSGSQNLKTQPSGFLTPVFISACKSKPDA